ncbi:phosphodiesterase [Kitasatospora viridis]|uniref:3',5'-cyclic AMP phosphodiesterase CpdA n=1 Tax=Kitasatospora viridis TaxID=281105 RepID=A0A561UNH3_9ACTN|nr:phosphodiesterase [Kitasatospora viridis]TWG00913.1 3',5'-cyclic AMP phosphodiesterase CpdA [Kitasatospora viridis]
MTPSLAHLSDPHLTTGPADGLHRALGRVLALDPHPTCVVITGDLTDRGRPAEYAALREALGEFPLPLHLLPGNHDDPAALATEFGGSALLGGGESTHYVVDHPGLTVVALDSAVAGSPAGELGTGQLAWLDGVLAERPETPAVVCLHHPPAPVGIPFLDRMRLADGPALAEVLARHPQVVRVLAGHAHRPITAQFAGALLAVAPSASGPPPSGARKAGRPQEPAGLLLHLATADGPWVTHHLQLA